ncbi:protein mrp [Mycobacterium lepromatosis]|nr:protein mrp [Mycobacterium lepromatosis]
MLAGSRPYATGVIWWICRQSPGSVSPLGDAHLERPEGLGPGLPLNVNDMPINDRTAQLPLIDFNPSGSRQHGRGWRPPHRSPWRHCLASTLIYIDPPSSAPAPTNWTTRQAERASSHLHSAVMSRTDRDAADLKAAVNTALAKVIDPELQRPITELGMVKSIDIEPGGNVQVGIYLTIASCPKKSEISKRVTKAIADVPGTAAVEVSLDVMSDEQRTKLRKQLRGDAREPVIPFTQPGSLTRVYTVASGKGGVGKSTITVNLTTAMATRGLSVGLLDADIHGHSIPRMIGNNQKPIQLESMIIPPLVHQVKVISIGQFTEGNTPIVWRGPMLHRALQQFLTDVYWGDLDVLLLDLPPGTGDIAISVAQLIPNAEILVVTTPQLAAAEVAERAGSIALQTRQRIVGVVENMSGLMLPDGSRLQVFGEGGGQQVAERLSRAVGADVPLLGQIPLDPALVAAGDSGVPIVLSASDSPVGKELLRIADGLSSRRRGLAGVSLGLDPSRR